MYQTFFGTRSKVNEKWKSEKLSSFFTPRDERAVPDKKTPLYSLTIERGITPKTERYDSEFLVKDKAKKKYKVVYPGDVVFNPANLRWGAIARSYIKHKVVVSPIYEVLQPNTKYADPEFLHHIVTCPRQISIFCTKTEGTLIERMAVKLDVFLTAKIVCPEDIGEQRKVGRVLETAQLDINILRQQIEKLRIQKVGLMQKLLTGKWSTKFLEIKNFNE